MRAAQPASSSQDHNTCPSLASSSSPAAPGYCTESVLVETFEEGRSVAHFMRRRHPQNTQIVSLGVGEQRAG